MSVKPKEKKPSLEETVLDTTATADTSSLQAQNSTGEVDYPEDLEPGQIEYLKNLEARFLDVFEDMKDNAGEIGFEIPHTIGGMFKKDVRYSYERIGFDAIMTVKLLQNDQPLAMITYEDDSGDINVKVFDTNDSAWFHGTIPETLAWKLKEKSVKKNSKAPVMRPEGTKITFQRRDPSTITPEFVWTALSGSAIAFQQYLNPEHDWKIYGQNSAKQNPAPIARIETGTQAFGQSKKKDPKPARQLDRTDKKNKTIGYGTPKTNETVGYASANPSPTTLVDMEVLDPSQLEEDIKNLFDAADSLSAKRHTDILYSMQKDGHEINAVVAINRSHDGTRHDQMNLHYGIDGTAPGAAICEVYREEDGSFTMSSWIINIERRVTIKQAAEHVKGSSPEIKNRADIVFTSLSAAYQNKNQL